MSGHNLDAGQCRTLFHYLTHEEAFFEFGSLKIPGRIAAIGPPFRQNPRFPNEGPSPILEKCTREFVMTETLPAFDKVKDDSKFWGDNIQKILENMAEANLSDSFDKGKVSKRKILGMSVSVFIAGIARGMFGKVAADQNHGSVPQGAEISKDRKRIQADDLIEAWRLWKIGMIYNSNLTEALQLMEDAIPTDQWPANQFGAALYVKLTLASVLHYIFVASPDGADTTNILSRLHDKLPYWTIRQTLKIPYATQMVQGMIKVFLAKPMFGGKSLLQTLISTILGQDQTRCEKGIERIEKAGLSSTYTKAIKAYVYDTSRKDQNATRARCQDECISIIAAIVGTTKIDAKEHSDALQYLELTLSRRDRVELIRVLTGDEVLTSTIRAVLDMFFPIIAELHKAVSLPDGLADAQTFLTDLIALANSNGNINQFVKLVDQHEPSFTKFASKILRKSPTMKEGYVRWYHHCLKVYTGTPAMDLASCLSDMEESQRASIVKEIENYGSYLDQKRTASHSRLSDLLAGQGEHGFGEWLGILADVQLDARVTPKTPTAKSPQFVRPNMSATRSCMLGLFRDGLMYRTPEHVDHP